MPATPRVVRTRFGADNKSRDPLRLFFLRQLDSQIPQLPRIDLAGRMRHQIDAAIVFRESHHFADAFFAADQHDDSIEAERDPAMGRRAKPKGSQHVAKHVC